MTKDPDVCLACGADGTINGHLCRLCFRHRVHTVHWRWHDQKYMKAIRAELDAPITTASAARFARRQQPRRI